MVKRGIPELQREWERHRVFRNSCKKWRNGLRYGDRRGLYYSIHEWTRTTLFCIPATQMAIDVTPRATKQLADLLQGGLWSATRKRTDPLQGGELTFSDADSDEETRGSSTRGELIISDSDSDEEGCGYGSNEPIILDSDSDSDLETNYGEPASKKTSQITTAPRLHCVFVAISQISQIRRIPIPVAIPEFRVLP